MEPLSPSKNTYVPPTNKVKLGMKGKLGIGALGLAVTGVIGYGLARKIRSDKGKKRRFYNR